MTVKVAVNGFGRIGRNFLRALLASENPGIELVAVNDVAPTDVLAHMLKYDSIHGVLEREIKANDDRIDIDGTSIQVLSQLDPAALPWKDLGIDVVVESTGIFTERAAAAKHLEAGARKVVISAPATEPDITIVMGVNDDQYDSKSHNIISNASCTTNSVGPMARILLDNFGISSGFMTTIHAYTTDQQLQDQIAVTRKGKANLRQMRAAALNIIPTATGAAKALSLVIPELKGKLDGMAMRVPVPDGSVTDLVCVLEKEATAEEVNAAFQKAANSERWRGILTYTEDPIVSSDIVGNPASCIIDGLSTLSLGSQVKVIGWYDNEWGYSNRLVDLVRKIA